MTKDVTNDTTSIPSGSIINFIDGPYDDSLRMGTFKALQELRPSKLLDIYLNQYPDQRKGYRFIPDTFVDWLTLQGYVEQVNSWEWNVDYHT